MIRTMISPKSGSIGVGNRPGTSATLPTSVISRSSARTIAVGLPGGMNYAFDAARCSVQFGWAGAFLDVGPDRDGRGGRPCKTLGPRFGVGDVGFPLRAADGSTRPTRFRGYCVKGAPAFDLEWGGVPLVWSIAAAGDRVGLTYTFAFEAPLDDPAVFVVASEGLSLSSPLGAVRGGRLEVPAGTQKFAVTVENPEAVR